MTIPTAQDVASILHLKKNPGLKKYFRFPFRNILSPLRPAGMQQFASQVILALRLPIIIFATAQK
ncbi:MAG: hypothetical protein ACOYMA_03755 [Bacteroidia bacterium]